MKLTSLSKQELQNLNNSQDLNIEELQQELLENPHLTKYFYNFFNSELGYPNNDISLALLRQIEHNIGDISKEVEHYGLTPEQRFQLHVNTNGQYELDDYINKIQDLDLLADNVDFIHDHDLLKKIAQHFYKTNPERLKKNSKLLNFIKCSQLERLGFVVPLKAKTTEFDFNYKDVTFVFKQIDKNVFCIFSNSDSLVTFEIHKKDDNFISVSNIDHTIPKIETLSVLSYNSIIDIREVLIIAIKTFAEYNKFNVIVAFTPIKKIPPEIIFIEQQIKYTEPNFVKQPQQDKTEDIIKNLEFTKFLDTWRFECESD